MFIDFDNDGHEQTFVQSADVKSLIKFLDPSITYVWILGHMPCPAIKWWDAEVPIDPDNSLNVQVRDLRYDLQMETSEFIKQVDLFNEFGLVLIQSTKPMPDTLMLERIPEEHQSKVLINNGAVLRMFLPHAIETAMIVSYRKGYLGALGD